MGRYRSGSNGARQEPVGRPEALQEAGEVFTPAATVATLLALPSLQEALGNPRATLLEPAAGEGAFLLEVLEKRLKVTSWQEALASLWGVEIQEDNLATLRSRMARRVRGHASWQGEEEEVLQRLLTSHFLQGSYLTRRACTLTCPHTCEDHEPLPLPLQWDLVVGNPPFNPGRQYQGFLLQALKESKIVAFILPTTFFLSQAHASFRKEVAGRLASLHLLPQETFPIKPRTAFLIFREAEGESYLFEGKEVAPVGASKRLASSLLVKAYEKWGRTWEEETRGPWPLFLGWKCNRQRGLRVNALQALSWLPRDPLLPHNVFKYYFPTQEVRASATSYLATKTAAYFQALTHGDTVSASLPLPPPTQRWTDEALYESLDLTPEEREEIEAHEVYLSHKAASFFKREGFPLREDLVVGKERKGCEDCGSSSFHRRRCRNSTELERSLRDEGL